LFQVNARQQTERDPSKPAFKDGAVRQMCLVLLLLLFP
jgi:adenine nucleotide transporter 17